jgi:hypothetical protein
MQAGDMAGLLGHPSRRRLPLLFTGSVETTQSKK